MESKMEKFSGEIDGKALALFVETKRIERARQAHRHTVRVELLRDYIRHAIPSNSALVN
jgi:hypothetical protein